LQSAVVVLVKVAVMAVVALVELLLQIAQSHYPQQVIQLQ
jgi:hypothetical protein